MPYCSTTVYISALHLIIKKTKDMRKNHHLYIAFIDLKATFDTVHHSTLWNILKTLGAPTKIIILFQQMYNSAERCVCVNGKDSKWFAVISGVHQGCVTAPDLINCVINYRMARVCEHVLGVSFSKYSLTELEYVDNTSLLANMPEQLRDILIIFDEAAKKLALTINWSKTLCILVTVLTLHLSTLRTPL